MILNRVVRLFPMVLMKQFVSLCSVDISVDWYMYTCTAQTSLCFGILAKNDQCPCVIKIYAQFINELA